MNYASLSGKVLIIATVCLLSMTASAYEKGNWVLRGGATNVSPDDSSGNVFVGGTDLGVGVSVDSNTQLGINVAYFPGSNWNIELLAATPFEHDVNLNTVGPLGSVKHLPPSLTANYYFLPGVSRFQPYVGAGLNWTIFFSETFTDANSAAGFANLSLDDSFGVTVQAGADIPLSENLHLNASVRYIDIETTATFTLNGTPGMVDVAIDPFVYTLSIGWKF